MGWLRGRYQHWKPVEDMMTPEQVSYVQQSFAQLHLRADTVAARFYGRSLPSIHQYGGFFPTT
jgi:hypothetical protein